jgi:sucrose-6-phosphate hydrolase SacC (GH32 family)
MNRVAPWESSDLVKWNLSGSLTDALKATALSEKPSHAYCDFFSLADKWVFAQMGSGTSTPYNHVRYAKGTPLADSGQSLHFIFPKSRCFAPQSLQDSKGRRIVWSWVQLPISWISYFAMTIPSVVTLNEDGIIGIEPVPETETALMAPDVLKLENIAVPADSEVLLEKITEECSKIVAEIDPGDAKAVGLRICCPNEGGDKGIYIGYNSVKKILSVDSSNSASDYTRLPKAESATWNEMRGGVTETPFSLSTGEPLRLKVFIDGPLLEVYANGRQYLLCLIPPQKGSAWRIKVCSQGTGMTVRSLSAQYGNKAILDKLNEGINALAQPKK